MATLPSPGLSPVTKRGARVAAAGKLGLNTRPGQDGFQAARHLVTVLTAPTPLDPREQGPGPLVQVTCQRAPSTTVGAVAWPKSQGHRGLLGPLPGPMEKGTTRRRLGPALAPLQGSLPEDFPEGRAP